MTSTERLVEAVMFSEENGMDWWEVFDSPPEAMRVLKAAKRERPDEGQLVCLLSAMGSDVDMFELCTADSAYKDTLQQMFRELKEVLDG